MSDGGVLDSAPTPIRLRSNQDLEVQQMLSLVARPIPNGYSWTLTSRLYHMLEVAQQWFGPRDMSYTILGIEFESGGPQIWYPGNCKYVAIQLTPDTATDMKKGCYQLAHECVHLLSPTGGRGVNNLEEGVATYFAHRYLQDQFNVSIPVSIQSYETARQYVAELLAIDETVIKQLRESEPTISKITAKQILKNCPTLNPNTAHVLEAPFSRQYP